MTFDARSEWFRRFRMVGVSALAVVLVAAVADPDPNWTRIRALPSKERTRLIQGLRKFDLELSPDKQEVVRDLDRRIAELDPQQRARSFWVLRRYHDWLASLPENRKDEVLAQPVDGRLAMIRKLLAQYPVPTSETPELLRIAEVGELTPFELASVYKIWEGSSKSQREHLEREPQARARRKALLRLGNTLKPRIPPETRPADFDEEHWTSQIQSYWLKTRPVMLLDEAKNKGGDEAARARQDAIRREIHRRQAINLYTSRTPIHAVDPEKLTQFVTALPGWLQHTVDQYPPDEASRRLTWAYRLVFPYPEEIGATQRPSASPSKAVSPSTSKKAGTTSTKPKPAPTSSPDAPF